jgi:hypothetical protein
LRKSLSPRSLKALRRGSQVVRQRSAKPLFAGSIPARASRSLTKDERQAAQLSLGRFLYLFETSPRDLATFASASAVLLGVSVLASYLPARRAAGVDPAVTLRSE